MIQFRFPIHSLGQNVRRHSRISTVLVLALFITPAAFSQPSIWYVDDDAPLGGDGESWQTAFKYLQDAVAYAIEGDEIRIAGGTYTPDRDELGFVTPFDRFACFELPYDFKMYGGYAGRGAPNPDARDFSLYETILSGDLLGDDGPGFTNYGENSHYLIYSDYVGLDAVIEGMTFRAARSNERTYGAVTLMGGAIEVRSCLFQDNYGDTHGSAVYSLATLFLTDSIFTNNIAHWGGAITSDMASLTAINCEFYDNTSTESVMSNLGGGAILLFDGSADLTNCTFIGNQCGRRGGALLIEMAPTTITNCLFSGNHAAEGGAFWFMLSNLTITNSVFSGNSADDDFGGVNVANFSHAEIVNSIFWGNSDSSGTGGLAQLANDDALSTTEVSYCCIQNYGGGYGATGVITANPLFQDHDGVDDVVGTPDDNLQLQAGSPCIDAGDNTVLPWDWDDLDQDGVVLEPLPIDLLGNPRNLDDPDVVDTGNGYAPIIDLGCYERLIPGIAVSATIVEVPEGGIASFTVALSTPPAQAVMITTAWDDGDSDISVLSGGTLSFDAGNYDQPQTVTLAAAPDVDDVHGMAILRISGGGFEDLFVYAFENDSEAMPAVVYVDDSADPNGDGTSWNTAFTDLQDALEAADSLIGEIEIWIAAGIYHPDRGAIDRESSFVLRDGVAILGGFAGNETTREQRDPSLNPTILSGDLGSGVRAYHVVDASNCDETAIIDGFTIRDGDARLDHLNNYGGGFYCQIGSPTVIRCIFENNLATLGGAFFASHSNPRIIECEFRNNEATGANNGAAIFSYSTNLTVSECVFHDNDSYHDYVVFSQLGTLKLINTRFLGNSSQYSIVTSEGGTAFLMNTLFSGNAAPNVLACHGGWTYIANCDFGSNAARGMHLISGAGATVSNTVFWGNTVGGSSNEDAQIHLDYIDEILNIRYCCVQGWTGQFGGIGNHGLDPLFADPDGADDTLGTLDDDYRLSEGSPCIDVGANFLVLPDYADLDDDGSTTEATPLDLDLEARFVDDPNTPDGGGGVLAIVDMGAYEYGDEGQLYCRGDLTGDGDTRLEDLAVLLAHYGIAEGAEPWQGDIDYDGDVDIEDLAELLAAFVRGCE